MQFTMGSRQDTKSALKLAQFYKALRDCCSIKVIEKLLDKEGDIDYAVPVNSPMRLVVPSFLGFTALHFNTINHNAAQLNALLTRGADFTKKNEKGETVLHISVKMRQKNRQRVDDSAIKALLSAHVNTNNFSNPCDNNGLSHFHIACMENDSRAVQFFLENGISADEADSFGSTPLHFAAMNTNTEVAEILLGCGVNMYSTDSRGMTPLHILIERRIQMYDLIGDALRQEGNSHQNLQEQIGENEKIINMLLENMSSDNECPDSIGLTNFHVACILQDTSVAQYLVDQVIDLDHCVNMNSPLCPGYTALHFAAHVSIEKVKLLMDRGANFTAADLKGKTALDICIEKYKVEDVCNVMSLNATWSNMLFSNGHTNVLSLIRLFANKNHFKRFLDRSLADINTFIPIESALWPGYTPLHLAVQFAEKKSSKQELNDDEDAKNEIDLQVIRLCLRKHADLNVQDARGQTALHLAFRLGKMKVVGVIFRHSRQIPNVFDDENLSHLHIACAVNKTKLKLKKLALNNEEINAKYTGTSSISIVTPGSTPLHVSIAKKSDQDDLKDVIRILLNTGADVNVKDAYGLTPIHWILKHRALSSGDLLYETTHDCEAEGYGINYLQIACFMQDHDSVKYFIEQGANVNLAITYTRCGDDDPLQFLSEYNKYTPLQFSHFYSVEKVLVENGADVFAEKNNGSTGLDDIGVRNIYMTRVWNDVDLQARMESQFGWTKLHLACCLLKADGFEELILVESRNINARVLSNSPIWKGYTPLHILMYRPHISDERMSRILLEHGADVTIADDKGNTPIGMLFEEAWNYKEFEESALLMLKYQRNFTANPVNTQSVSHFHLACYVNDVDTVEGFLSHGNVDVNQPIDFFSDWRPGYSPLHLTTQLHVIEILVNHGANVDAENVDGRTILHNAVEANNLDENIITRLIESGVDVNRSNFKEETPFEIAISEGQITMEKLMFFIRNGFHVNSCNPVTGVGYIAIILRTLYNDNNVKKLIIEEIMKQNPTKTMGRTNLHNCVPVNWPQVCINDYVFLFEKLIKSGEKFEQWDDEGKTVLHLAVDFQNQNGLEGLLAAGVDINILDANGRSALSSAPVVVVPIHSDYKSIRHILTIYACRLVLLNLHLNRIDAEIVANTQQSIRDSAANHSFRGEVALCKEIELINDKVCLYDFLSETGVVASYPLLTEEYRKTIDEYFETINSDRRLIGVKGILKLQHRKAVKRIELLPSSADSFNLLLGFNLPYLCVKNVFRYLGNSDLQNIINTAVENENIAMDVD